MANDFNNLISVDEILDVLEKKVYLNPKCNLQPSERSNLVTNLVQFTSWFNDVCRRDLLKADENTEVYFSLLLQLKKNINFALSNIGTSVSRNSRNYVCSLCDEVIAIESYVDTWDALQSHEHFEASYLDIVSEKKKMLSPQNTSDIVMSQKKTRSPQNTSNNVMSPKKTPSQNTSDNMMSPKKTPEKLISHKKMSEKESFLETPEKVISPKKTPQKNMIPPLMMGEHRMNLEQISKMRNQKTNNIAHPSLEAVERLENSPARTKNTVSCSSTFQSQPRPLSSSDTSKSDSTSDIAINGIITSLDKSSLDDDPSNKPSFTASSVEEMSNGNSVNSFKFNFEVTYYDKIERLLYPESLMTPIRKCDCLKDFSVQRTGSCRAVCLICRCELKHPFPYCKVNKNIILSHVHGQKHLKNAVTPEFLSALKSYHETFIGMEIFYQSQSVYFMPDSCRKIKCVLCGGTRISLDKVAEHVLDTQHKNKIIDIAKQMDLNKTPRLFAQDVMDIQLNHYGVTIEAERPKKKATTVSNNENNEEGSNSKTNTPKKIQNIVSQSDSSSSSDIQNKHTIVKSVIDPNSNELTERLPFRFRNHEPFLSKTGEIIKCDKCEVEIGTASNLLKKHVQSEKHLNATKMMLPPYNYYCEICNISFINEILWTDHFAHPVKKHSSIAKSRIEKLTEYECTTCKLVIFGDEISLMRHIPKRAQRRKKEYKLPETVIRLFKSTQLINQTGRSLCIEANQVLDEQDPTWVTCRVLEKVLSETFPDCKAFPFGSRISGFGNKDSDLDVFLDTGGMYLGNINQNTKSQINFVNKSRSVFARYKEEFSQIVAIPSARTPIVKLWHSRTDLDCDISFRHGLSVENTKFLKYFTKVQPSLQMLVLLLKKWSHLSGFYENITTYAFAMLAIFYMQVTNYLPSVVVARNLNPTPPLRIDGWIAFDDTLPPEFLKTYIRESPMDLKDLLKGFFYYYAAFDYSTDVVCPLLGRTIKKELFTPRGELLPEEMITYVNRLNTDADPEMFRSRSEFCIQDPFDLSHNLTKACPGSVVQKLKKFCELSSAHLATLE